MASQSDVFLRAQRRLLLHHLFSPWRRRGARLLQVGLASGLSPDFFWEAGFDVSVLSDDMALLEDARGVSSPKVDFHLGQYDHYPFDDGDFDYIILAHLGINGTKALSLLTEATRVASHGVIILEWNRFSLPFWRVNHDQKGVWPWKLDLLARRECPDCRIKTLSVLPLPPCTWPNEQALPGNGAVETESQLLVNRYRSRKGFYRIHNAIIPIPVGAILGMRIELDTKALTPLGVVTESLRAASRQVSQPASRQISRMEEHIADVSSATSRRLAQTVSMAANPLGNQLDKQMGKQVGSPMDNRMDSRAGNQKEIADKVGNLEIVK